MDYTIRYSDPGHEIVVTGAAVLPRIGEALILDEQEYRVIGVSHRVDGTRASRTLVEVAPGGERTD